MIDTAATTLGAARAARLAWVVWTAIGLQPASAVAGGGDRSTPAVPPGVHDAFGVLLERYVVGDRVDYAAWVASNTDRAALESYVASLERLSPATFGPADALAYWINLYNAATLRAVLAAYPIESIRAIHPDDPGRVWTEPCVRVDGRARSLDDVENGVIRKTFGDPRVHFALSCASLGCPPLQAWPFEGEELDEQLELVTRRALADPRWVRLTDTGVVLSRIFEWYRSDFVVAAGSVAAFIARHRDDASEPGGRRAPTARFGTQEYGEYDWRLNAVR